LNSNIQGRDGVTVWLHASSVGEVQAVRPVILELKKKLPSAAFILTTMTLRGRDIAETQLADSVQCFLAPLDVPGIVGKAIKSFAPDIYICMETELWPVLIDSLSRNGVRLCLVNGRLSEKSFGKYLKTKRFIRKTIRQFDNIAVISASDRKKFLALGARDDRLTVEGIVAGSTHDDEELLLCRLLDQRKDAEKKLLIIAPRHLERLEQIIRGLREENNVFQLLSAVKSGAEKRTGDLLIVDTMGDLAQLYGIGDYIFCGGSLVAKGGHNLMEAAVWDKAVFYGPHIEDFHDAAALLEQVEAGFRVADVEELALRIDYYRSHLEEYNAACLRAGEIARQQRGSAARQAAIVLDE
jgi:3-deoxy-D-manno-octulosonic-acid transferase